MNYIKLSLAITVFLISFSTYKGPSYSDLLLKQVYWLGSSESSYEKIEKGVKKVLQKHFGTKASNMASLIIDKSIYLRLDPLWVVAIVWTESSFNPKAISPKGARGLMQVMPRTAVEILEKISSGDLPHWLDAEGSMRLGSYYLKKLLLKFNKNHKLATMAYNLGPYGLMRRIRETGVPKMIYWERISKRYEMLALEVHKDEQVAKTSSTKTL